MRRQFFFDVRVFTSVGHGEQTRLGVLQLEVLIGELLSVDGLATSSLGRILITEPAKSDHFHFVKEHLRCGW